MSNIERRYCLVRLRLEDNVFLSVDAIYTDYKVATNAERWYNAYVASPGEFYTIWPVVMET